MPKLVVGIADLKTSADPEDVVITYALGSCLGISAHDPVARVGGLVHVMTPSSALLHGPARRYCRDVRRHRRRTAR